MLYAHKYNNRHNYFNAQLDYFHKVNMLLIYIFYVIDTYYFKYVSNYKIAFARSFLYIY